MLKSTRRQKGWLLPYLVALDQMFFKRWSYWLEICRHDRLPPDVPIPYIAFKDPQSYPEGLVKHNLLSCLNKTVQRLANPLDSFLNWLLWGFNYGDRFPDIDAESDDFWYRTFNLGLLYKEPADHWPQLLFELQGKGPPGFFPTPPAVVELMTRMNFGDTPQPEQRAMSVCDPCCGTGNMLLYASNYSLNLYGQDISPLLTKMALINGYLYMPWLVYCPKSLTIFKHRLERREQADGVVVPHCPDCTPQAQHFTAELMTRARITNGARGELQCTYPDLPADLKDLDISNLRCARNPQVFTDPRNTKD